MRRALGVLLLTFVAASAHGQESPEARQLRTQLEEAQAARNRLQDQLLTQQRRFDEVKLRLMDEKERVLKESAAAQRKLRLEAARLAMHVDLLTDELARAGVEAPPAPELPPELKELEGPPAPAPDRPDDSSGADRLDRQAMTVSFNGTPLAEVATFLRDVTELQVELRGEGLEDLTVLLRVKKATARDLLDLLVHNARDGAGAWVDLTWRREGETLVIERAR